MFVKAKHAKAETVADGVSRKVLARGGGLMAVEVIFKKGGIGATHSHAHEQISYVIQGSFEYTISGKTEIVSIGDSCYVPPNALHGVLALEDGVLMDVFSPQREDFLK